ncbi:hypothetical protein GOEFS_075_00570 [Gordonia effusa NBRC 100432]|uniref:DUF4439 domain-containing protein n=2 Tax=Gordonia effusa TaxID=263908 RepID=H0R231_9ACTN|nr:hypothetical protein GOEFS_075_00570 [Gordonia effusa NBRC 100432]
MASWSIVTRELNRRTVLAGSLLGLSGLAVAPALSACDRGPTADQLLAQQLTPVATAATADADAARTLVATNPNYAAALGVVRAEREAHATALREELTRLDPEAAQSLPATPPTSGTPSTSAITLDSFRTQLDRSARQAADVGVSMDGYRAGLLASVSASTTTLRKVQLA